MDHKLTSSDFIKILFAILLPPLAAFIERGLSADFIINIFLTILFWIPGVIHALYLIYRYSFYKDTWDGVIWSPKDKALFGKKPTTTKQNMIQRQESNLKPCCHNGKKSKKSRGSLPKQ